MEAYTPYIRQYAEEYGIGEYVELIKAVMMQESGGRAQTPCSALSAVITPPEDIFRIRFSLLTGAFIPLQTA